MTTITLRLRFLDPMRRDYRGRENQPGMDAEIVNGDMKDLECSDLILANCPAPSYGTAMEIFYSSKNMGKRVVTVCSSATPSPWLTRWSHAVVPELSSAVRVLAAIIRAEDMPQREWFVYLAGPINACTDAQCLDWREQAKAELLRELENKCRAQ